MPGAESVKTSISHKLVVEKTLEPAGVPERFAARRRKQRHECQ